MKPCPPGDRSIFQTLKNGLGQVTIGVFLLTFSACGDSSSEAADDSETKVLRFSAIPDRNTTGQSARFQPVADYLSEELGITVKFVPAADYGASVEKFENGDIQLAWFGGVSGVQAREAVDGARAIAAGQEDLAFKSYFIANAATGLEKSEDFPTALAGLTFTYGSPGSTSGCLMPSHFIMEETGKLPFDFFDRKPGFSGAHDSTALAVQDGTFQAGVLNYSTYEKMVADGKIDPAKARVIWETPTYADYNFTAHPQLNEMFGEGFIEELQEVLVACQDPAVLKALNRSELVKVSNETFQAIAEVMESVSFD